MESPKYHSFIGKYFLTLHVPGSVLEGLNLKYTAVRCVGILPTPISLVAPTALTCEVRQCILPAAFVFHVPYPIIRTAAMSSQETCPEVKLLNTYSHCILAYTSFYSFFSAVSFN